MKAWVKIWRRKKVEGRWKARWKKGGCQEEVR